MTRHISKLIILFSFFIHTQTFPQELAVAVGPENIYSGGSAFDGTHYLMALINLDAGVFKIELQIINPGPSLGGYRISTGKTGSGPYLAYDGTNYLLVFTDPFPFFAGGDTNGIGNLYGQLVSKTGQLIGSTFNIASNINLKFGQGRGTLSYNNSNYLVTYCKGGNHYDYLYGQLISKTGTLVGSPVKISSNYARDHSVSFDGSNYFLAWCEGSGVDQTIHGQFLNTNGQLVGTNFLIDGTPNKSDNPVAIDFDGNDYVVLFPDQSVNNGWNIYSRTVSKNGNVSSDRMLIIDSTKSPLAQQISFDGTEHLVTWIQTSNPMRVKGKFFSKNGDPIGNDFIAFDALGGKGAMGGVGGFIDGHFMLGAIRVDSLAQDCDVYIKMLDPLTSVNDNENLATGYKIYQNFPNPFNPGTAIKYSLPSESKVSISVYNLLGQKVTVLLNDIKSAGTHEVYFNAEGFTSGVYLYTFNSTSLDGKENYSASQKMLYLK